MQNAFVESLNGRLRDECLNEHIFGNLAEAREIIETWRIAQRLRSTRPASLELRNGSAQHALTATLSTETNRNRSYA